MFHRTLYRVFKLLLIEDPFQSVIRHTTGNGSAFIGIFAISIYRSMWLGKFQAFTKSKDLESANDEDYKAFLTFLAVKKNVAASTRNQAFNALLFSGKSHP